MDMLDREFYNRDSTIVAGELLGKVLVHETDGQRIAAKIVETEAYMGISDKAAHSYGGRRTPRVEVMYGGPGYSYVFFTYGMYHCFNIVTREAGNPQAVLIRAAEPVEGLDPMAYHRFKLPYGQLSRSQTIGLTNGPGKLCMALSIDRSLNGEDLCGSRLYVCDERIYEGNDKEDDRGDGKNIVAAKRIGIDYAEEAKEYLWRFYLKDNQYVSSL